MEKGERGGAGWGIRLGEPKVEGGCNYPPGVSSKREEKKSFWMESQSQQRHPPVALGEVRPPRSEARAEAAKPVFPNHDRAGPANSRYSPASLAPAQRCNQRRRQFI